MTREQLVGAWMLPDNRRLILGENGSAIFIDGFDEKPVNGSWKFLALGRFELLRPIPSWPDGPNMIPGYNQVLYYEVESSNAENLSLQGFEGGEGGLEFDSEVWTRGNFNA